MVVAHSDLPWFDGGHGVEDGVGPCAMCSAISAAARPSRGRTSPRRSGGGRCPTLDLGRPEGAEGLEDERDVDGAGEHRRQPVMACGSDDRVVELRFASWIRRTLRPCRRRRSGESRRTRLRRRAARRRPASARPSGSRPPRRRTRARMRRPYRSATSVADSGRTMAPRLRSPTTNPSASSMRGASRTVVRDRPSFSGHSLLDEPLAGQVAVLDDGGVDRRYAAARRRRCRRPHPTARPSAVT